MPKKVWLNIQVDPSIRRTIKAKAKTLGMKMGPLVEIMLEQSIKINVPGYGEKVNARG
jgi:antitoxin component of RelBE/YafQ-DinJ toxin-antitoxin module